MHSQPGRACVTEAADRRLSPPPGSSHRSDARRRRPGGIDRLPGAAGTDLLAWRARLPIQKRAQRATPIWSAVGLGARHAINHAHFAPLGVDAVDGRSATAASASPPVLCAAAPFVHGGSGVRTVMAASSARSGLGRGQYGLLQRVVTSGKYERGQQ
jgi:hypothetical protein